MSTKANIGIGALVVVLLAILLTEGVLFPKQFQGDLAPVKFKGFRKGGLIRAVFEIENQTGFPVVVWEHASVVGPGETTGEDLGGITIERTVVPKDGTAELRVEVPDEMKDQSWRVLFAVAKFGPREQKKLTPASP